MLERDLQRFAIPRTLAAAGLCALLVAALPGSAAAQTLQYDFLASELPMGQAEVCVGTSCESWPEGSSFSIEAVEVANRVLDLTIRNFFIPDIRLPFRERFQFQTLDEELNPTDTIRLSAIVGPQGHWQVNPAMTDPYINVKMMERTASGTIRREDILSVPLTTSTAAMGPCPTSPGPVITGEPMDPATGGMAMVGAVCIEQFDYLSSNNLPFFLNVEGVMAAPEPAAASLGLAAVAALGLLRRRRAG